jgi:hypothetical protein
MIIIHWFVKHVYDNYTLVCMCMIIIHWFVKHVFDNYTLVC